MDMQEIIVSDKKNIAKNPTNFRRTYKNLYAFNKNTKVIDELYKELYDTARYLTVLYQKMFKMEEYDSVDFRLMFISIIVRGNSPKDTFDIYRYKASYKNLDEVDNILKDALNDIIKIHKNNKKMKEVV